MNKRDYPLSLARNIQTVIEQCSNFCIAHSVFVEQSDSASNVFGFRDTEDSGTYFFITSPKLENGECFYELVLKPFSEANTIQDRTVVKHNDIIKYLDRWLNIVKGYRELNFTPEDYFQQMSEEEFYTYFVFEDEEEAATKPYELRKQILLSEVLEVIEEVIQNSELIEDEVKTELIHSAVELKESLTSKTQKAVARGFAKLFTANRHSNKHGCKGLLLG